MLASSLRAPPAACPPCRCVPDVHEPRLQRFPDPAPGLAGGAGMGAGSGVHCMAVLPPSVSSSGALEVRWLTGSLACHVRRCCVGNYCVCLFYFFIPLCLRVQVRPPASLNRLLLRCGAAVLMY